MRQQLCSNCFIPRLEIDVPKAALLHKVDFIQALPRFSQHSHHGGRQAACTACPSPGSASNATTKLCPKHHARPHTAKTMTRAAAWQEGGSAAAAVPLGGRHLASTRLGTPRLQPPPPPPPWRPHTQPPRPTHHSKSHRHTTSHTIWRTSGSRHTDQGFPNQPTITVRS